MIIAIAAFLMAETPLARPGHQWMREQETVNRILTDDGYHSQCLASVSAIDTNSLRLVLDMFSKNLISLLTGLPRFN